MNVWCWFVLGVFWKAEVCFEPPSLLIALPSQHDHLLCVAHTSQNALEVGQEDRIVQMDFSAAFDRVNHLGILFQLWSVGVGGSVLSVLTQFLSNKSQYAVVDGCRSKLVNVMSWLPQ